MNYFVIRDRHSFPVPTNNIQRSDVSDLSHKYFIDNPLFRQTFKLSMNLLSSLEYATSFLPSRFPQVQ